VSEYDAVIVGAGPNGLTAAARLAVAGRRVVVFEGSTRIGGGTKTEQFAGHDARYDVCSAAHPFGALSPAFTELRLDQRGLLWCHAPVPLAHPFDDGDAAVLYRGVAETAAGLGIDGEAYRHLVEPLLARWPALAAGFTRPLVPLPSHPVTMARFGLVGRRSATAVAGRFQAPATRALLAGLAAHSYLPLDSSFTAGLGLSLGLAAHAVGWPVASGGSQAIAHALAGVVFAHGGEIVRNHPVGRLTELPPAPATLLDVTPRQVIALAGDTLGSAKAWGLRRWRYGPAACKVDYLLSGPMPWTNSACRRAGVLHLGGRFEDIASAEATTGAGRMAPRPFTLVAQPSLADSSRAPAGHHVLWAYCHVPHGDDADRSAAVEGQLDRFAPGWRDLVVARVVRTAGDIARSNPNSIGGDIAGGSLGGLQLVVRPWNPLDPYRTPLPGVWMCSASTPPGAGAHGMCGWHAAGRVLAKT
jgi:phytoene dehydrogenase-like protein